jgi:tellurite resistance protein
MATSMADSVASVRPLEYLPISFFGSVMGLTGLSVAWKLGTNVFEAPEWISQAIGGLAAVSFLALVIAYTVKLFGATDKVLAEFRHPIAGNLFGTFLISLLLLPIIIAPVSLWTARLLWGMGALGMAFFAWIIVSRWMSDRQQVAHATPAWIVPVVGMLDVPLAMPSLAFPSVSEIAIFSLAVGLFFSVPLFTLIFSRLIFEPPMPDSLQPTLLILVAPFAVGFSSYVTVVGSIDLFAEALYFLTLFILAVLVGRLRVLRQCCPFRVAWWAVSFPLAASTIAGLKFCAFDRNWFTLGVAGLLLAATTVIILALFIRTLLGIVQGEMKTLSG